MQSQVKIIADSINQEGKRITTFQLRYWRGIHAELMTHRVFSRNASSSRAVPVKKMLEQVRNDPAMPARFGGNKPGMQDTGKDHDIFISIREDSLPEGCYFVQAREAWMVAANRAADIAEAMMESGYHKQVCNRLLEPFQFINVIVTATEWENFFALRNHEAAEPTIHELAAEMQRVMKASKPRFLGAMGWHLPYVDKEDAPIEMKLKMSVARCARVSYLTHEGKTPDVQSDLKLYDRLVGSDPKHMSPTEHQAYSTPFEGMSSNLKGWTQYRKFIEQGQEDSIKSLAMLDKAVPAIG